MNHFTITNQLDILHDSINAELALRILVFFGGKTSPLMLSEYLISLKSIPLNTNNYNHMIKSLNENQYLYERSDTINLTEKEKLERILGR